MMSSTLSSSILCIDSCDVVWYIYFMRLKDVWYNPPVELLTPFQRWALKHSLRGPVKVRKSLTDKEIRYAMIKGKAEKKHPELRPSLCRPLSSKQVESLYQLVKGK